MKLMTITYKLGIDCHHIQSVTPQRKSHPPGRSSGIHQRFSVFLVNNEEN